MTHFKENPNNGGRPMKDKIITFIIIYFFVVCDTVRARLEI